MELKQNPPWLDAKPPHNYPALSEDTTADVVVIGGGMAGTVTAYLLSQTGKQVILLEKNRLGMSATAYTTAFVTSVIDTSPGQLVERFGTEAAKHIWQSQEAALDFYQTTVQREKIECEFVPCPGYIYTNSDAELEELRTWETTLQALDLCDKAIQKNPLGFPMTAALQFDRQATFHPLKFLWGLAEKTHQNGGRIFENTEAVEIKHGDSIEIKTNHGTITAQDVIVLTDYPFHRADFTREKLKMFTTYVLGADISKDVITPGVYSDLQMPYHYFRIDAKGEHDEIILGGEDHPEEDKNGQTKSIDNLVANLAQLFPRGDYTITRSWDGQIPEPFDGIPLIGQIAPHEYVGMGFSGNGMTYSAVTGLLLRDLVLGRDNPWAAVYDPLRKQQTSA